MTKEQLGMLILDSERQLYSTAKTMLVNDYDCEDDAYQIYYPEELLGTLSGEDCDHVIWDGVAQHKAGMSYYSVYEEYGNGTNYIPSLKPHESIQVNMAWIVNENVLDHIYLNLSNVGGPYEFWDDMSKAGIVNICQ